MSAWTKAYSKVLATVSASDAPTLYYRGHANAKWQLLPGLARIDPSIIASCSPPTVRRLEEDLYSEFLTQAGGLLPRANGDWDNVFAMQHHGMPTRLLDWTETFAIALFFALRGASETACVWILDPFELNRSSIGRPETFDCSELGTSYRDAFFGNATFLHDGAAAISVIRHLPRISSQRATFTLHGNLHVSLEKLYPTVVTKIPLPVTAHAEAREYLALAGVSEFSLFPDLDGLAREMREKSGL